MATKVKATFTTEAQAQATAHQWDQFDGAMIDGSTIIVPGGETPDNWFTELTVDTLKQDLGAQSVEVIETEN